MIEEALLQIREDIVRLRNRMRAKGHERADAAVDIESNGQIRICLRTGEIGRDGERAFGHEHYRYSYEFCYGETFAEALRKASEAVAGMDKSVAIACEAWFAPVEMQEAAQ